VTLTTFAFLLVALTSIPTIQNKYSTYFPLYLRRKEYFFHILSFGLKTLIFLPFPFWCLTSKANNSEDGQNTR
jgi:hypothetical protein